MNNIHLLLMNLIEHVIIVHLITYPYLYTHVHNILFIFEVLLQPCTNTGITYTIKLVHTGSAYVHDPVLFFTRVDPCIHMLHVFQ